VGFAGVKLNTNTTETQRRSKFVVVYGGPRTGTSLTMDIVVAAQYNPGRCYGPPDNPRRGRNEHRLFGQPMKNWGPSAADKIINKEKITCAKIIGFPEWIGFLSKRFDVKIIAPERNKESRNKSAADMLIHLPNQDKKVKVQEELLEKRKKFLDSHSGPVLHVSFEDLVNKDLATFWAIAKFVGYDGQGADLMAPVDPGRVKFDA